MPQARVISLPRPLVAPRPEVLLTLTHPRIVSIAKEVKVLEDEGGRQNADTRSAIGKLLSEAQASLAHGDWLTFIAEQTPYTQRSASRYMILHRFSVDQPVRYHDLRHLGASKLYLIASLDDGAQRDLLKRQTHVVPGHKRRLRLEEMTYQELLQLLFRKQLEEAAGAAVKSFDRRIKRLGRATRQLLDHSGAVDQDEARAWCEALREAADLLAEAFDLEA